MVNLPQFRDLFRPGMYQAAGEYQERYGVTPAWDMVVSHEPPGISFFVTVPPGGTRRPVALGTRHAFISEAEIERAQAASLEWRYRLVAGPEVWRIRPLWKRRDYSAVVNLYKKARDTVFA